MASPSHRHHHNSTIPTPPVSPQPSPSHSPPSPLPNDPRLRYHRLSQQAVEPRPGCFFHGGCERSLSVSVFLWIVYFVVRKWFASSEMAKRWEGYSLRESPKKTWRVCGSSPIGAGHGGEEVEGGAACDQCGRVFRSWRAVFGHMRCHDSPAAGRRSRRRRRRDSAAGSGVEPGEEVEVAVTLMMLSRDGLGESSENNSVGFRGQSSVLDKGFGRNDWGFVVRERRSESSGEDDEYFVNGGVEWPCSDDSDGQFIRNDEIGRSDCSIEACTNVCDDKMDATRVRVKLESVCDEVIGANLRGKKGHRDLENAAGIGRGKDDELKTRLYYCKTCHKGFASHQALGGHRGGHKKAKVDCAPRIGRVDDDSLEIVDCSLSLSSAGDTSVKACKAENLMTCEERGEASGGRMVKEQGYQCHVCLKVFASGQALGGHKRWHLPNGMSDGVETVVLENRAPDLLDLNIPASSGEFGASFDSLWGGSAQRQANSGCGFQLRDQGEDGG